jgi:hypothetical protein
MLYQSLIRSLSLVYQQNPEQVRRLARWLKVEPESEGKSEAERLLEPLKRELFRLAILDLTMRIMGDEWDD